MNSDVIKRLEDIVGYLELNNYADDTNRLKGYIQILNNSFSDVLLKNETLENVKNMLDIRWLGDLNIKEFTGDYAWINFLGETKKLLSKP